MPHEAPKSLHREMTVSDKRQQEIMGKYGAYRPSRRKDDARTDYNAYGEERGRKNLDALELRLKGYQTEIIFYSYLMRISCNGDQSLILKGTDFMAYIDGQRLGGLIRALKDKRAEYIQEFDPNCFLEPDDEEAPFIREIRIAGMFEGNVASGGNA